MYLLVIKLLEVKVLIKTISFFFQFYVFKQDNDVKKVLGAYLLIENY